MAKGTGRSGRGDRRADVTGRAPRGRPHPVDRMREINAIHDPDPFGGRPPIESIEIRQRTYVTAQVQPLDVTGTRTIAVGALLWLVAAVALLPFYSTLDDNGRGWWVWTCVAGVGLGLIGVEYCRRRRRHLSERPPREVETSPLGAAGL
ncbi:MAG: DUF2530 domain-containing protein [Actinomycetota bacterium]|nr:DUF2530 domain-containing protein [Actinomycetota bacterium]